MKQFIVVLVITLIYISSSEIVQPNKNFCTCDKIKSQADCNTISSCKWTPTVSATAITFAIPGSCRTSKTPTTPPLASAHCLQVTQPATNCWKTLGCAYIENQCTHFTGCTAYVKISNSECQAISKLCITDGTQCVNAKSCNEYLNEGACKINVSISGIFRCKWDKSICRDYTCKDADSTLNTNADCNAWLSGCMTTGKGCIGSLGNCSSYIGDDVACSGLRGTDGYCEGTPGGTNCTVLACNKAAATLVTDVQCEAYQLGCITTGKGCTTSPLPPCSSYTGDDSTCLGYIGSDGICEGDHGAMYCRSRICTNAPTTNNTDQLCSTYKNGCVTTGKGCEFFKSACEGYSGTIQSCIGYIGSDGYCEGSDDTISSPCVAKVCSKAPSTASTDQACEQYQKGCISTGKGCTTTLGRCSSYSGTNTTCEGYIGKDGNCKGTLDDTDGPCTPKICTEAPKWINTNQACATYQIGCVTNGFGCISQLGCLDTIQEISCQGTPNCAWNNICVLSKQCSDFLTVSICNGNNSIFSSGSTTQTPCYWTGQFCRNLTCTDAPVTHNTDSLCNSFLEGCLTNGKRCLDPSAPCSEYFGDRKTCSEFTRKCWNLENALPTASCNERVCNDDISSITDLACDSFKSGCRTKGSGCIDPQTLCSGYSGTQNECDAFKGNNGQTRCWALSTTTPSSCLDKTCTHSAIVHSNEECETFLSGCLYNGAGCVPKSSTCSSYIGTQSECSTFKGTNQTKICWSLSAYVTGRCIEKECYHAPTLTNSDADCEYFLTGCLTNGSGCVPDSTPCTSFTGTLTECEKYVGNGLPCSNKDACTDKLCSDKLNPQNNDDCENYLSTCRYFNGTCVNAGPCQFYSGTSLELCQDVLDIAHTKCWWFYGALCVSRSCSTVPNTVTNQFGCDAHILNCMYAGTGICVPKGTCDQYPANGTSETDKLMNCQAMSDKNGKSCFYTSGANCESKTCLNVPGTITGLQSCNAHISGCSYNGSSCEKANACVNYMVIGTDQEKLTKCQHMTDTNIKPCWWTSGNVCSDRSCFTATSLSPVSQNICDIHISASCVHQYSCIRLVCLLKTDAANNQDCATYDSYCRFNGSPICIAEQASCTDYVLDSSVTTLVAKQTICAALTDSNAGTCSYNGTGKNCRVRACIDKVDATADQTACSLWKSTCRWTGKITEGGGCQDMNSNCAYSLDASFTESEIIQICEQITDNLGNYCMAASSGSTCVARTCAGKITDTANQAACIAWMPTCQFTGKTIGRNGCQEMKSNCAYTLDASITVLEDVANTCEQLKDIAGNSCMAPTSGSTCVARTCAGKITPTADQAACAAWMTTCRFTGKTDAGGGCQDASIDCVYTLSLTTSTAAVVCITLTDLYGNGCMGGIEPNCVARTCEGKPTFTANQAECNSWMPSCRFSELTTAAIYYLKIKSDCAYTIDTSITSLADAAKTCEQLTDIAGNYCMVSTSGTSCVARTCAGKPTGTANQTACTTWMTTCRWTGKIAAGGGCQDMKSDCTYTLDPSILTLEDTANTCEQITDSSGNLCMASTSGSMCLARTCQGKFTSTLSQAECSLWKSTCRWTGKTTPGGGCQDALSTCMYSIYSGATSTIVCPTLTDLAGNFCQAGTGTNCTTRTCAGKIDASSHADCNSWKIGCQWTGIISGTTCAQPNSCFKCEARNCQNILNPTSNINCIDWLSSCRFTGSYCVTEGSCSSYNVSTGSDQGNRALCEGIKNASGVLCAYVNSQTNCSERTCSLLSIVDQSNCISWLGTSCRWDGTQCLAGGACNSYSAIGSTDNLKQSYCMTMTDTSDPPLNCNWTSGLYCIEKNCFNVFPIPITDSDCQTYLSSCRLTNTSPVSCVPKTYQCSQYMGTAAQCKYFKGVNDTIPCWSTAADSAPAAACIDRQCNHNIIATTNFECNSFLPNCKTNGHGCVNSSTSCSTFEGNASICAQRISSDGINFCKVTTSVSHACTLKSCYDDGSSTTDASCQAFMDNCVTRGIGCVPNTEPCSTYQGNQAVCSTFTGNFKKCWNDSADSFTYCVDKKCSDDQKSTTDDACKLFLNGCLTKGVGCIEDSAPCWVYQGTQATCSGFMGKKMTPCWNVSTALSETPCIEKACFHNTTATSNSVCEAFLPRDIRATFPKCVTSGNGCVDYPITCSGFAGTTEQCGKFTAADGPCKTTATGACTPRICTEALNSYNTDKLCKQFHPSCVTNGYGCATSVSCPTIQEKNSCIAKTGCSWVSNCQNIKANCSALTIAGASICVNTPVSSSSTKCAWYNNACRAQTIQDLPTTISTHQECQEFSTSYTSTGSGCTIMGPCISYSSEVVCKVAMSTDVGQTCVWDTVQIVCRARKCIDVPAQITNAGCDSYLTGCKTNGISCIAGGFSCPSLLTVGSCILDDQNKPCLWVNDLCYNFSKCEDISKTTHDECQEFSPQCTSSGDKCIAITTCDKTTNQQSCRIGTDGTCGWLPTQKCQKFKACSDAAGISSTQCALYGSNCITDGTKCTDKSQCSTYLTQLACDQSGTDGPCIFNLNVCRLRECSDATSSNLSVDSHSGCNSYIANTQCTTNGTSCIPLSTCSSYTVEVGCVLGTDGSCIFSLPVSSTTGTISCRLLACSDFQKTTSSECSDSLIKVGIKTECVSDGIICIAKAACKTYKSKEACNGGGTDGQCAFTPQNSITPEVGSCKLMTSCADANSDSFACNANSDACELVIQEQGTTITTSCIPHTCSSKGLGSKCIPVPSFDHETYTICGYTVILGCTEVSGSALSDIKCQELTMNTYTWDETKCSACFSVLIQDLGENPEVHKSQNYGKLVKSLGRLIFLTLMAI